MRPDRETSRDPVLTKVPLRSRIVLALVILVLCVARLPLMYRQPAGIDEEWVTIAGWTVATNGVPSMPYAPSRTRASAYYMGDMALFHLPPGYFYWKALFFRTLDPSVFVARLASFVPGVAVLILVYSLGRTLYRDETLALCAAGLLSLSRAFFSATMSRPDIPCAAWVHCEPHGTGSRQHNIARSC